MASIDPADETTEPIVPVQDIEEPDPQEAAEEEPNTGWLHRNTVRAWAHISNAFAATWSRIVSVFSILQSYFWWIFGTAAVCFMVLTIIKVGIMAVGWYKAETPPITEAPKEEAPASPLKQPPPVATTPREPTAAHTSTNTKAQCAFHKLNIGHANPQVHRNACTWWQEDNCGPLPSTCSK